MENKLYINKRLILVMMLIVLLGYISSNMLFTSDDISTIFSTEEMQYINENKNEDIIVNYEESYILNETLLKHIKELISNDLGLNIIFEPNYDSSKKKYKIFDYPSAIYSDSTEQVTSILNLENSIVGIVEKSIPEMISDYYPDTNLIYKEYNNLNELTNALNIDEIDYFIYEYSGDVLIPNESYLIFELKQVPLPVYIFENENNKINNILNKAFTSYLDEGIIYNKLVEISQTYQNEYIGLDFTKEEIEWLKTKESIKVGLEEFPPNVYIKNSNVYGLAVAYANRLSSISKVPIEYVIGEEDKLVEMLNKDELDYVSIVNETENNIISKSYYIDQIVVVSKSDFKIIEDLTDLYGKEVYFYGSNQKKEDFSKSLRYLKLEGVESFSELIKLLDTKGEKYFILSKNAYHFLNSVKNVKKLNVNIVLDDYFEYKFISNDIIASEIINNVIEITSKFGIYENTVLSIPTDGKQKQTMVIMIITVITVLVIFIIFITIRLILNINEKQRLNYLFIHDQLTYLPNNYGLKKLYTSVLNQKKESGIILLLDINKFKLVNDKYGGDAGDQILIEIANEFNNMSQDIIVGRTGGDEFTFLLFNDKEPESVISNILETFENFTITEIRAANLSVTISYVSFPEYADDYDTLIQYVESAMYYAKKNQEKIVSFTKDIYSAYLNEQEMSQEISLALDNHEFLLYYQPQVELQNETTIGAEVLIRWIHPDKGFIYPDQFLSVAERNGLMRQLDMYMIENACTQIKYWQENGYKKLKISVNMSTSTFDSKNMVADLLRIVNESNIDTSWLALEITEESGLSNLNKAKMMMDEIKLTGIRFALDDFGKGYSSLNYLEKLPFDFLKIDKAFIDNIHINDKSKSLYSIITKLAKLFDMSIITEGVEHLEQIEIIRQDIDTIVQGYYYSKPLPLDDFNEMINRYTK